MIQNRTEAAEIVDLWAEQIKLALPSRKLFYLYVANDVLQKSRKSEFPAEFAKVMPTVLQGVFSHTGPEVKLKVKKILNIWRVRDVYCEAYLEYWESMAGLDGLQNVHSTDGASPDEDEIEAIKMASELKRLKVPPSLGPVVKQLEKLEPFISLKNICYSTTCAIKSELYDIQDDMKITFDRKINEDVAVQVQNGMIALENYGRSIQEEIEVKAILNRKVRKNVFEDLKKVIEEQENCIKILETETGEVLEKKFKLEQVAKDILPRIFFSEVKESSKVPLISLAESVGYLTLLT